MDIQQIIVWAIVGVAAWWVGRVVWAELRGFIKPSEAGGCPGCGGCDAADAEQKKGVRAAPVVKTVPLVSLQTTRPAHLQRPPKSDSAD